jgi:hypothetical protein
MQSSNPEPIFIDHEHKYATILSLHFCPETLVKNHEIFSLDGRHAGRESTQGDLPSDYKSEDFVYGPTCRVPREWKGTCWIGSQAPAHAGSSLAGFLLCSPTLKMEAIGSSETSVNTISARRHISEDCLLHSHRHENFKSYVCWFFFNKREV